MKPIVYLATVTDQYRHPEYPAFRHAVRVRFPAELYELVEPAHQNWSLEAWHAAWREILPSLHTLVVWPRPDFVIGRGVFSEIRDCQERAVPILILPEPSSWYLDFRVELTGAGPYRHWARIQPLGDGADGTT